MAMDITRLMDKDGPLFNWRRPWWSTVLALADQYGWERAGTEHPQIPGTDYSDWDGNYSSNDCQTVTDEDARAMAAALQSALDDTPGENVIDEINGARAELKEFVAFLREGSFQIL